MDQAMYRVTKRFIRICEVAFRRFSFLLLIVLLACSNALANEYFLDLTIRFPESAAKLGMPGGTAGGTDHGIPPKLRELSLDVALDDLYPAAVSEREFVNVTVVIRNIGKQVITVPASRDYARIFRPPNQNQRTLTVCLLLEIPGSREPLSIVVGESGGSTSEPDTLIALAPGDSVRIRGRASLRNTQEWHKTGIDFAAVKVRAEVEECYYKDDEYFVNSCSERRISPDFKDLVWRLSQ